MLFGCGRLLLGELYVSGAGELQPCMPGRISAFRCSRHAGQRFGRSSPRSRKYRCSPELQVKERPHLMHSMISSPIENSVSLVRYLRCACPGNACLGHGSACLRVIACQRAGAKRPAGGRRLGGCGHRGSNLNGSRRGCKLDEGGSLPGAGTDETQRGQEDDGTGDTHDAPLQTDGYARERTQAEDSSACIIT